MGLIMANSTSFPNSSQSLWEHGCHISPWAFPMESAGIVTTMGLSHLMQYLGLVIFTVAILFIVKLLDILG